MNLNCTQFFCYNKFRSRHKIINWDKIKNKLKNNKPVAINNNVTKAPTC